MFSLGAAAASFQYDQFYVWDSTGQAFSTQPILTARLFRVDRFKSIYHRPTRRRKFTLPPGVSLPASRVVRHRITGSVYLLSETLEEEQEADSSIYDAIGTAHLADSPSGGLATIYRPTLSGTGNNLGAVSLVEDSSAYLDTELRTTVGAEKTEEVVLGEYLLTLSPSEDILVGDFILLRGVYYRVQEAYFDGGFRLCRAEERAPAFVNFTYKLPSGTGGGYNTSTGAVTAGTTQDRVFSALVTGDEKAGDELGLSRAAKLELFVWKTHVGFSFDSQGLVTLAGAPFRIAMVEDDKLGLQYRLLLESA